MCIIDISNQFRGINNAREAEEQAHRKAEEKARREAEAKARQDEEDTQRKAAEIQRTAENARISTEILDLTTKMNSMKGLFAGIRRKKQQARIDELNEQLCKLQ